MPIYDYECLKCEEFFDKVVPLAEYDHPQVCPTCGEPAQRRVTAPGFILKGDNWPSKAGRIRGQMAKKNARLDIKSEERRHEAPGMTLAPNVGGERVDSWSDAQKLAASQGKDTSSYDPLVRKERGAA